MQNDMRDRLVELICHKQDYGIVFERSLMDDKKSNKVECPNSTLADYLNANGVIALPCKVNDVIYCIATVNDALCPIGSWGCCEKYRIVKCTCKSINTYMTAREDKKDIIEIYCTDKTEDCKFTNFHFLLKPEDFGERAFVFKEQAEQKLKEMRGGNDL